MLIIHFLITVNQPTPPKIDCTGQKCETSKEAQRQFVQQDTTTRAPGVTGAPGPTAIPVDPKELVEDLKRFCRFRNDGEHALPANCDVFIYCSHGIGSFAFCPNGTKFNPSFLTCDHQVNHECRFETRKLFIDSFFF